MSNGDLELTKEARNEIERLVKKYAIGTGLVLLFLNIVAGITTILAFWSYVYGSAKEDYTNKTELLMDKIVTKSEIVNQKLITQNRELQEQIEKEIITKFNSSFIRKKAEQILEDAFGMHALAHSTLKTATESADDITKTTKSIELIIDEAEQKANDSLNNAKASSIKISETFVSLSENENTQFADWLVFMRKMKKDGSPLVGIGNRMSKLEDAIATLEKDRDEYKGKLDQHHITLNEGILKKLRGTYKSRNANRPILDVSYFKGPDGKKHPYLAVPNLHAGDMITAGGGIIAIGNKPSQGRKQDMLDNRK